MAKGNNGNNGISPEMLALLEKLGGKEGLENLLAEQARAAKAKAAEGALSASHAGRFYGSIVFGAIACGADAAEAFKAVVNMEKPNGEKVAKVLGTLVTEPEAWGSFVAVKAERAEAFKSGKGSGSK